MLEQLDLFGDTPSSRPERASEKPKGKSKIVPPTIIITEAQHKVQDIPEKNTINDEVEVKEKRQVKQKVNHDYNNITIPEDDILFSKQYYPISEVANMLNVNISLLRFWEKEFDIIKPR